MLQDEIRKKYCFVNNFKKKQRRKNETKNTSFMGLELGTLNVWVHALNIVQFISSPGILFLIKFKY